MNMFCEENGIRYFYESITLEFLTRCPPTAKGLLVGYRGEKFAISMGPEIPVIYLVSREYLLSRVPDFTLKCKYCIPVMTKNYYNYVVFMAVCEAMYTDDFEKFQLSKVPCINRIRGVPSSMSICYLKNKQFKILGQHVLGVNQKYVLLQYAEGLTSMEPIRDFLYNKLDSREVVGALMYHLPLLLNY